MARKQITVTMSSKCLELIDEYAKTTGLEARSRVIEEAIFSINDLLKDENMLTGTLDRFRRFPIDPQDPETTPKKYRRVPPEERNQKSRKRTDRE